MEERPPRAQHGGDAAAWLEVKARLAAAVAVIKSRPPGVSGREYAERLAVLLRSRDDVWRSRAQELQEEVLHLRQELFLTKMAAQIQGAGRVSGDGVLSQDLRGPAENEGSVMDCDSGCGMETVLTPTDPVDPVDPVNPAVPVDPRNASSDLPRLFPPPQTCALRGRSMQCHMQFLQSLCGLRRAGGGAGGGAEPAWLLLPREDSAVLADSLLQLLGCVVSACGPAGGPLRPPGDLVQEACRVLAGATDAWCLRRQPSARFVEDVEVSLKALVELLFHGDLLCQGDRLAENLLVLGGSALLRPLLIRHLLSRLGGLAEKLCHLCQVEEHSEPEGDVLHHYEVSFHLFWVLETLLQKREEVRGSGVTGPRHPQQQGASLGLQDHEASLGLQDREASLGLQDHEASLGLQDREASLGLQDREASQELQDHEASQELQERKAFLELLGRSTLLLSDEFPLFALYMWRVGTLLSW